MTKLFVGGLPYSVTSQSLEEMFNKFGAVQSAQVISDRDTGQSKGFGFVEMANDDEAQKAIQELNGIMLENRTLGVSVAKPREDKPRNDFSRDRNSGGGGGGNRNFYQKNRR